MSDYRRVDRGWVRDLPGWLSGGYPAHMHVTGPDDDSPEHVTYPSGYDSRCSWCYLHAPHSEWAHAAYVTREEVK